MSADRATGRTDLRAAIVAGVLLVVLAVLVAPAGDDTPLDPRATGPRGAAGVLDVLRELGTDVTIGAEVPATTGATVLLLADRLDEPRRAELSSWVEAGGRLVLLDPASPLSPAETGEQLLTDSFGAVAFTPSCPLLDGLVEEVASSRWTALTASDATARCFNVGATGHGLVVVPVGDGEVAVTAAADAFTNAELGESSNGRFALALLAPRGGGSVLVLWDDSLGGGDTPVWALLPDGVVWALWILGAAVVLFAWSRSRRLGRPVSEALPVRVPGSELVHAIGELLERHGHRDAAAARIRADLRRELATALSLPADTPPDVLAEVTVARVGGDLDPAAVTAVLTDAPVPDDDALARLAATAARLRRRLATGAGRAAGGTEVHE